MKKQLCGGDRTTTRPFGGCAVMFFNNGFNKLFDLLKSLHPGRNRQLVTILTFFIAVALVLASFLILIFGIRHVLVGLPGSWALMHFN
jgi:fatty acid desaturase